MFCSTLTAIDPTWNLSIHTLSSSSIGNSISCFRSLLYLFPHNVSSSVLFDVPSPPSFPSSSCWLYSLLNENYFISFTIDAPTLSSNAIPQQSPIHLRFLSFLQHNQTLRLHIHNAIIDPSFPIPELTLTSEDNLCDGWFGITFHDSLHTTHICSPHLSDIFHLYHLPSLIPVYPSFRSFVFACT